MGTASVAARVNVKVKDRKGCVARSNLSSTLLGQVDKTGEQDLVRELKEATELIERLQGEVRNLNGLVADLRSSSNPR